MNSDGDQPMLSRGLEQLSRLIESCANQGERHLLIARKAGALARLSRLDEARHLVAELRAFNTGFEPRLSAWIMFTEGLVEHFSSLSANASGRFRRSHAVSVAAGDNELTALSSAWIANSESAQGNPSAIAAHLGEAFALARPTDSETLSRACLVVADALNWSGSVELAKVWYRRARDHAVACGDIAMQSVVLFNSASFHVSHLVLRECERPDSVAAIEMAAAGMEIESISNLDRGLGVRSLTSMVPLLRAELASLQRQWQAAIDLFDLNLPLASEQGQARLIPKWVSERAWCKVHSGEIAGARIDAEAALERAEHDSELDDLVVLYARAADVFEVLGEHDRVQPLRTASLRCMASLKELGAKTRAALQDIADRDPTPKG